MTSTCSGVPDETELAGPIQQPSTSDDPRARVPLRLETAIAYDRTGAGDGESLVLIHAGIADRRMWEPVTRALGAEREVIRVDLRGYGESTARPSGSWSARADVLATLDALGIERAHLIGCSFGAGVAAEIAVERPGLVATLALVAPGGALLTDRTDDLLAFFAAEEAALEAGDLEAAVDANVRAWVDGPHRGPEIVPAKTREAVRSMQRLAFEITADWPDSVWEDDADELDPPLTERLHEIVAPTLVVVGEQDMDAVRRAADHVLAQVPDARGVVWSDVAHLPSMERPGDFVTEVRSWIVRAEGRQRAEDAGPVVT